MICLLQLFFECWLSGSNTESHFWNHRYANHSRPWLCGKLVDTFIQLDIDCLMTFMVFTKLGQIIHEIGHIIGFFHEQSRPDRDEYITINWENIMDPVRNNVNFQAAENQIDSDLLAVPYDINSIMHYQPTAFGINSQKTIEALDKNLEFLMGNRVGLSFYDSKTVSLAYKCSGNLIENLNSIFCVKIINFLHTF